MGNLLIMSDAFISSLNLEQLLGEIVSRLGNIMKAKNVTLLLYDKLANGGSELSRIKFGLQAANYSIGRIPNGGSNWVLNLVTLGRPNAAATLGNPANLKIYLQAADGTITGLPTTVNPAQHTITAKIPHLTNVALAAPDAVLFLPVGLDTTPFPGC